MPALQPDSAKLISALQSNWIAEMQGFYTYSHLAEREEDAVRRKSLRGIATAEKHHADLWADRLHALGAEVPHFDSLAQDRAIQKLEAAPETPLRLLELDEGRDIAKYGQQLRDLGDEGSETVLETVLRDEQEHYRLLQKLSRADTLPEAAAVAQAQSALEGLLAARETSRVQEAVGPGMQYGVNDGLGSIFGIVSGVSGATLGNSHFVLIAGLAGMVASAFSMGSGAYLAAKSEREIYEAEYAREQRAVELNPVEARELLSLTYQVRGLPMDDADRVVEHLSSRPGQLAQALAKERLHTSEEGLSAPLTSALSGALSTAVGAFIPIVPFFFTSGIHAIVLAAAVSLLAHFAVGAAKSFITLRSWWASGFEMTWIGAAEGAVTYVIGMALGHIGS